VGFFHGPEAARDGRAAFDRQFRDRELPDDIPELQFGAPWPAEGVPLAVLLRELKLARSSSEARRLVQQGGVRLAGEVALDPMQPVARPDEPLLVQVGKKRFARVKPGS
jgi:tyrosyl-tRNA synthetase